MAQRLRDRYGPEVPVRIAQMLRPVVPGFDAEAFTAAALIGYEELELTGRAAAIAAALALYLPPDRCRAIEAITAALPDLATAQQWSDLDSFVLLPFGMFIAEHGLDCFEESMTAQYEITKRFTSEFSIRAFIEHRHPETMARLRLWTADPDEHVRRLVSEGTRPRLPWAPQLQRFRRDPRPVLELLELLRDDPCEYVRRSVANNLNDIAKDHPALVVEVCRRWWADGGDHRRRRLVRHALRTLVKRGDPQALAILGFRADPALSIAAFGIEPARPMIGDRLRLRVEVANPTPAAILAIVDFEVDFARPGGRSGHRVFSGRRTSVPAGGSVDVVKTVSLAQHSTRTHYPGTHTVVVLINGMRHPVGSFDLRDPDR